MSKSKPESKRHATWLAESFPLHMWPYFQVLGLLGAVLVAHHHVGCPEGNLDQFLPKIYDIAVCGGPGAGEFELNKYERVVYFLFSILGVFVYVIPKHLKKDGAKRMYVTSKVTRVLVLHIVSGLFVVLSTGIMGIFAGGIEPDGTIFWAIAIAEVLHELTILRLLKNHDGIFALRVDNATAGFAKFQTLLNYRRYSSIAIADRFFLASWGFMGTRIGWVLSWLIMFLTKDGDGIYLEHTYSLGVSLAIHHIVWRAAGYGTAVWLFAVPIVSYFYYHELWGRKFKLPFVAGTAAMSGFMIGFATEREQFFYMIAFHAWTFTQPMYYRLPKLALGGTMGKKAEQRAIKEDPALRAVYRRNSFDGDAPPEGFDVQKAEESYIESLPKAWDMGMESRGSKAWVPNKEYRLKYERQDDDSHDDSEEDNDRQVNHEWMSDPLPMMDETDRASTSGVDSDSESSTTSSAPTLAKPLKTSVSASQIFESFPLHLWPYAPILGILCAMTAAHHVIGCPEDHLDQLLPKAYHIAVCGGRGAGDLELNKYERIAYFLSAILGVFVYVIPKHLKQDGARRMYVSNKVTRVLVVHIITGVFVVLATGLMGVFGGGIQPGSTIFWVIACTDMLHEITILRLLKNHDGIFALRIDNATAGFAKFQTLLNYSSYTPIAIADRFFLASWGFMGTRIAGVLSWIIMYLTKDGDGIYLEHTYSLGVSLAIHHIVWRASGYGTAVWLIVAPFVSYFYYHELWSRKFKYQFVATTATLSAILLLYATEREQFTYMIAFHAWTFTQPMYYRLPKLALGGTMDVKTEEVAVKEDPALRAIYRRNSFDGDAAPEGLDVQKAEEDFMENLPEGWDMGLTFRGSKAWAPSKEYRQRFADLDKDDDDDDDSGKKASEDDEDSKVHEVSTSAHASIEKSPSIIDRLDAITHENDGNYTALAHVLNNVLRLSSDDHEIPKALELHGLTTVVDIVALSPQDLRTLDRKTNASKKTRKPLTLGSRNLLASIQAYNVHHVSTYGEPLDWRTVDHETFQAFRVGILPNAKETQKSNVAVAKTTATNNIKNVRDNNDGAISSALLGTGEKTTTQKKGLQQQEIIGFKKLNSDNDEVMGEHKKEVPSNEERAPRYHTTQKKEKQIKANNRKKKEGYGLGKVVDHPRNTANSRLVYKASTLKDRNGRIHETRKMKATKGGIDKTMVDVDDEAWA